MNPGSPLFSEIYICVYIYIMLSTVNYLIKFIIDFSFNGIYTWNKILNSWNNRLKVWNTRLNVWNSKLNIWNDRLNVWNDTLNVWNNDRHNVWMISYESMK